MLKISYPVKYSSHHVSPEYTRQCKYNSYDYVLMQLDRDTHNRINDYLNNKTNQQSGKGICQGFNKTKSPCLHYQILISELYVKIFYLPLSN